MIREIKQEIKNLKTDEQTLKKFGVLFFVVLGILSVIFYLRGRSYFIWTELAAVIFLILGLLVPQSLKGFYKVWMSFAFTLGATLGVVVARIVLTLTFFGIITPLGLFLKVIGKDLLDEKVDRDRDTYWKEHLPIKDKNRYLKPF